MSVIAYRLALRNLKTGELQACGKYVAAAFRAKYHREPQITPKLVNGSNRYVKVYPIEHESWLEEQIGQFLANL